MTEAFEPLRIGHSRNFVEQLLSRDQALRRRASLAAPDELGRHVQQLVDRSQGVVLGHGTQFLSLHLAERRLSGVEVEIAHGRKAGGPRSEVGKRNKSLTL